MNLDVNIESNIQNMKIFYPNIFVLTKGHELDELSVKVVVCEGVDHRNCKCFNETAEG